VCILPKDQKLPIMTELFKIFVPHHRSRLLLASGLLFVTVSAGCKMVQKAADVPSNAVSAVTPEAHKKKPVDPVDVQQSLLRFADEYSMRMMIGVEKLRRGNEQVSSIETLQWKIAFSTETCAIASGPNAIANLLDMTVFVTAMRITIESHWLPVKFGESARPLFEVSKSAEEEIWRLTATVLKPEQQKELRQGIEAWHKANPLPESVLAARALGFATEVERTSKTEKPRPDSVFSLLRVDPLAGMDPAVREIAQTRLFAERALYVTQKMPMILRWQTELLADNALNQPAVLQLVANTTQLSASVERFALLAEKLPSQVSAEREAILKTLQEQERQLTPLINEIRQALNSGEQMSTSLNTTLVTFDALMKRFGVGEPSATSTAGTKTSQTSSTSAPGANPPPAAPTAAVATPPQPAAGGGFRIQDYTETAAQLDVTAKQLTELLRTLDQTLGSPNLAQLTAQVGPVVQQAQASSKEVVDYAFRKGLLLVGLALVAALLYRLIAIRFITPKK
jgi:hypothetical protein